MTKRLMIGVLLLAAGCSTTTETGYQARPLGDSAAVQRGYYAPAYSPEAREAEQARSAEMQQRRPDARP